MFCSKLWATKHIAHHANYIIFTFQRGNITESTIVQITQNHANHLQLKDSITGQNICRNTINTNEYYIFNTDALYIKISELHIWIWQLRKKNWVTFSRYIVVLEIVHVPFVYKHLKWVRRCIKHNRTSLPKYNRRHFHCVHYWLPQTGSAVEMWCVQVIIISLQLLKITHIFVKLITAQIALNFNNK